MLSLSLSLSLTLFVYINAKNYIFDEAWLLNMIIKIVDGEK